MNQAIEIVIVGGGISGLAAAYYLEQAAREQGLSLHTTVVEKEAQLGGKIATQW